MSELKAAISHNLKYLNMKPTQLNKYNFLFIEIQWQYLHGLCRRQLLFFSTLYIVLVRVFFFSFLLMWQWQVNLWLVFEQDNKMRYAWKERMQKLPLQMDNTFLKKTFCKVNRWHSSGEDMKLQAAFEWRLWFLLSFISFWTESFHTFFLFICAEKND